MQERIVLLGGFGQLGSLIQETVPAKVKLFTFNSKDFDICNLAQHQSVYKDLAPTTIINAAAYTQVDNAESEQERAFKVNAQGPAMLAEACPKDCRIIHFSTDFVFGGLQQTAYKPEDVTAPASIYGASKLAGEETLMVLRPESTIIRTAWLYSAEGHNFVNTMLKLMAERDELSIVNDQFGTPTSARTLAEVVWRFVANRELKGIYHWTDQGEASWYDFAVEIQRQALELGLLSKKISLRAISTQEYPTPAQRPEFSVLDKTATYEAINFEGQKWQDELKKVLMLKL
ncbi:MAG: dTDP-4-dehydrorhamnose reductase [SAR86 cluster bacterium]|uniref:dTDP-4-dehydrorhamnose reductase n=1 Tax=SAR86 cluster bacterium TaxID=2030880 RepID=A0A2A5CIQ7_9GAMM|nr:dTDP-4-dehydrorhamnose reductase [Gammaproteobacteria bacterium AH-315-E17]PCJ43643.1 MAG: dTDP-4-dehydrorhamnose reductase [SAR86 cluster bacterium]